MQKHRLQQNALKFPGESHPTYFLRPNNGHRSPGIKCPGSFCSRMTDVTAPGAPCYFMRGTNG
eukprot:6378590-Pyramimonas_sp.AAC.1